MGPLPRSSLREAVLRGGGPVLLAGPPGSGKTRLLSLLGGDLAARGALTVALDLMGAASVPERFVAAALEALPAPAAAHPAFARARELCRAGRPGGAAAVGGLFEAWAEVREAGGRPLALLLDAADEIRTLATFPGLREVAAALGAALERRRAPTVLATAFPTLARRLWPRLRLVEVPPLAPAELRAVAESSGESAERLCRACTGWPRHLPPLLRRLADGLSLEEAWAGEMGPGGALESACRATHEVLLLRSRGYGLSKAVLQAVAREEGLNLSALALRLGRSPGATRDYLGWLLAVDALRVSRKRYAFRDPLLRWWVLLHGQGRVPTREELLSAAREVLAGEAPASPADLPAPAGSPSRHDRLMEID